VNNFTIEKSMMRAFGCLAIVILYPGFCDYRQLNAQQFYDRDNAKIAANETETHKGRLIGIAAGSGVLYAGTMTALYHAWYKNHLQTSFHFHNDLGDWLQMDKGGHFVSAYNISRLGYDMMNWAGANRKKSIWLGGMFGSIYLSTVEILDGFSTNWGFSISDFVANSIGSAAFISQQLIWDEQRFQLKFSYHPTKFARYRPGLLGTSHVERILKDYNGQTFWLSANLNSFGLDFLPEWVNIAAGYGASGMTGGSENITGYLKGRYIPEYERIRKYYISFDIDLTRIETRSQFLRLVLNSFGFVKVPFPAFEFSSDKKFRFHPLYF